MKILVTGGTGVVGTGTVTELLRRGHEVVLLSRHACDEVRLWPAGVIAHQADVGDTNSIAGSAEGCDTVLHVTGSVEEAGAKATFARINVGGNDLTGEETTSQNDLLRRFNAITGRDVVGVPLPEAVASTGARFVSLVGEVGFSDDQLQRVKR